MENMIRFQNIVKKYGEKTIIDDLCLDVKRGEFVTIIGSSGCGKTTLLKTVNGLVEPNEGDVLVNGASIMWISFRLGEGLATVFRGIFCSRI